MSLLTESLDDERGTRSLARKSHMRRPRSASDSTATSPHGDVSYLHRQPLNRNLISITRVRRPLYERLRSPNALRIVVLHRGSFSDPIDCRLLQYDDGDIPGSYEALSYEWGPALATDPSITLNNHTVRVRTNLHLALQHIRREDKDKRIWIDQLSINQASKRERGHQVRIMGQIYANAAHVIVWLGPAYQDSDRAMEVLANWESIPKPVSWDMKGDWRKQDMSAILALLRRRYWRRVWVQQEIHLARDFTVHCGTFCAGKTGFVAAADFMLDSQRKLPYGRKVPAIETLVRTKNSPFRWTKKKNSNLESWLRMGMRSSLQMTEPRDLIYAMLGISSDCQNGEIVPDYEKPLSKIIRMTLAHCRRSRKVDWRFEDGFPYNLERELMNKNRSLRRR